MTAGRFITFEGGEGAGKSTQARLLAEALRGRGLDVVATREPGGAPGAERIRGLLLDEHELRWDPLAEALLHYAARLDHVGHAIRPALARGAWVVSDRFADSTLAYQGYGAGAPRAAIRAVHEAVLGRFGPDLTLILDIDPEAGLARARARAGAADRYERREPEFHRRIRDGFLEIAAGAPGRCVVIDAARPEDAVASAVLAEVDRRLPEARR